MQQSPPPRPPPPPPPPPRSSPAISSSAISTSNDATQQSLVKCPHCSRNFASDRIEKHASVCSSRPKDLTKAPTVKKSKMTLTEKMAQTLAKTESSDSSSSSVANRVEFRSPAFFVDKSKTGFVGLANQGATCYLNSLLQTLYMIPEFRSNVYRFVYDPECHGEEKDCIPLQLQRLFGMLQESDRGCVETKSLTTSFGWTGAQAFQQHDVQELCRVLFERLESVSGDFIPRTFQGETIDYVQCQECMYASRRVDNFLDVSLPIQGLTDLNDAFLSYSIPELLEGDNSYQCSQCNKKCRALKGTCFKRLPPILMLHLRRFDFDYTTLRRIKINTLLKFPKEVSGDQVKSFLCANRPSGIVTNDSDNVVDEMDGYELLSVLVHSGGAMGGHYFAYIREQPGSDRFLCFNDSHVSEASEADVESTFGGPYSMKLDTTNAPPPPPPPKPATSSSKVDADKENPPAHDDVVVGGDNAQAKKEENWVAAPPMRCANAYMLVYRKLGMQSVNIDVPNAIKEFVQQENANYQRLKEEHEKRMSEISVKVHVSAPGVCRKTDGSFDFHWVPLNKKMTLNEAIEHTCTVLKELIGESAVVRSRFRWFDSNSMLMCGPIHDETNEKTLEKLGIFGYTEIGLEVVAEGGGFEEYNEDDLVIRIAQLHPHVYDQFLTNNGKVIDDNGDLLEPVALFNTTQTIRISRKKTLENLVVLLSTLTNISPIQIVLTNTSGPHVLQIPDAAKPLSELSSQFKESSLLYVEPKAEMNGGAVVPLLEKAWNTISIRFNELGDLNATKKAVVDRRSCLQDLKQVIGQKINLNPSEFKIRRGTAFGKELKDVQLSLDDNGLCDGDAVFVAEGVPLLPDEYLVRFYSYTVKTEAEEKEVELVTMTKKNDENNSKEDNVNNNNNNISKPPPPPPPRIKDSATRKKENSLMNGGGEGSFKMLFEIPVSEKMTVDNLKTILAEKMGETDATLLRIREKQTRRVTKVLRDEKTVKECLPHLHDGTEIAVEKVEKMIKVGADEVLITVRRWLPKEQKLLPGIELALPKSCSHSAARTRIAQVVGISCDEGHNVIQAVKQWLFLSTDPLSMSKLDWDRGGEDHDVDHAVTKAPWCLRDGDVILCKDRRDAEIEVSKKGFKVGATSQRAWKPLIPEVGLKIARPEDAARKKQEADLLAKTTESQQSQQ